MPGLAPVYDLRHGVEEKLEDIVVLIAPAPLLAFRYFHAHHLVRSFQRSASLKYAARPALARLYRRHRITSLDLSTMCILRAQHRLSQRRSFWNVVRELPSGSPQPRSLHNVPRSVVSDKALLALRGQCCCTSKSDFASAGRRRCVMAYGACDDGFEARPSVPRRYLG